LERSKTEEGCRADHRRRSQYSPSNISERETHFDRDVHFYRWRVSYPVCGDISGFRGSSPGSRGNRDADWEVFDLETTRQTLGQAHLFENSVRTVFLPHLAITRIMQNVRNEKAVLSMDNCSPHLTPVVIDLLSEVRVKIVTFAPHTTQLFQALDLSLFGVLKRREQYQLPFGDDAGSARFIKKIYRDFRSTMTNINT
jgi:hypothetical protein